MIKIPIKLELSIPYEQIDNICCKAIEFANQGQYTIGSNYWCVDFAYKLKEELEKLEITISNE